MFDSVRCYNLVTELFTAEGEARPSVRDCTPAAFSDNVEMTKCHQKQYKMCHVAALNSAGRTQEFCSGGGGSTNSVEDRGQTERGSGVRSPIVRSSAGSGNLVQEISFYIVKFC